jgi:ornithine cyclodeaminase/alanine dehydrogenase
LEGKMDVIRILNEGEVRSLVTIPMALEAVEAAYAQKHAGQGSAWPLLFHEFVDGVRDMDLKSGNLDGDGIWGLKAISCYQDNPEQGRPVYHGTSLVFDFETGAPKAVLNAMPITRFRTGAAGAIGAKWLARADAATLVVCGDGGLCPYLIVANLLALPQLERVVVTNPLHGETDAGRLDAISAEVAVLLREAGANAAAPRIETAGLADAVSQADVIMCATPARTPYLRAEWVRPGTHVSCVGADKPGKQEAESALLAGARVVADDVRQCLTVGECEIPHVEGVLSAELDEIGAVIAGDACGRTSDEQITVFDSTGLSLQDLATIARIVSRAEAEGVGTQVEL